MITMSQRLTSMRLPTGEPSIMNKTRSNNAITPASRRRVPALAAKVGAGAFLVLIALRVLSVNVFAVITNDSVGYLGWATSPTSQGWIAQGYRQAAYPISLWIFEKVDGILELDRIFTIALGQRLLLVLGLALAWWALRWWSTVALLIISSSTIVVLTNFVLTEGLTTPLAVIAASLLIVLATTSVTGWRLIALGAVTGVVLVVLAALKLQFAVFLIPFAAAMLIESVRTRMPRGAVIALVAGPALVIAGVAGAQALENSRELEVFEPISERARAEWYGAWVAMFQVDDRYDDQALLEYYADGNLYTFLHGLEADEPNYPARIEVIEARIASMFAAAGTSQRQQQFVAFMGALRGGRTDDLGGLVNMALEVRVDSADRALTANSVGRQSGATAILERVNFGDTTRVLNTESLIGSSASFLGDHRPLRSWIFVFTLVVLAGGGIVARTCRWMALGTFAAVVLIAAALGSAYIDNARYLVPGLCFSLLVASLVAREAADTFRSRWGMSSAMSPKEITVA